jgi:hypothetical protein
MSFPCPTSHNQGQHKFGSLRFITKDRQQFAQYCRYCKTVRTGRFMMTDGAPLVLYGGLEKPIHEIANPITSTPTSTEL